LLCLRPVTDVFQVKIHYDKVQSCRMIELFSVVFCVVSGPGSSVGIATGYGLDGPGSNPGGETLSTPVQNGPGAHPVSCTMGTGSFPGVKSGRGVTLTPHPFLVPWSRKSRVIPQLPLWAVRPVQSLSACTRVRFTFFTFLRGQNS
jgi:hypothetical protein